MRTLNLAVIAAAGIGLASCSPDPTPNRARWVFACDVAAGSGEARVCGRAVLICLPGDREPCPVVGSTVAVPLSSRTRAQSIMPQPFVHPMTGERPVAP